MRETPARTLRLARALLVCATALFPSSAAQASEVYATNLPLVAAFHGSTYFVGGTGRSSGLYRSNGTRAEAVLIKHLGHGINGLPTAPTVVGDRMLFTVSEAGHRTASWYLSDGTPRGTRRTRQRPPRQPGHRVATLDDGGAFFVTGDPARLVYRAPGPGARPATLAQVGDAFAFGVTGSALYFAGTDDEHGTEPWISDGTITGTHRIADLTPGPASSDFGWAGEQGNTFPSGFVNAGGAMYALAAPSRYPMNVPHTPYLVSGPSPAAPVTIDGVPAVIPLTGQATGTPSGLWLQTGHQVSPERVHVAPGGTVAERTGGPAVDDQGTLIAPGSGVYVSGNTLRRGDVPDGDAPIVLANTARAAPSRSGEEPAITLVTRVGGDTWFLAPVVDNGLSVLWRSDGTAAGTGPVVLRRTRPRHG